MATTTSPKSRPQDKYFSTVPIKEAPEYEAVKFQGRKESIPKTWLIKHTKHTLPAKLDLLVLEASVSAGKLFNVTGDLMDPFQARLPALCPQLRPQNKLSSKDNKSRLNFWLMKTADFPRDESYVFIDKTAFSEHAAVFQAKSTVVQQLCKDVQGRCAEVLSELSAQKHSPRYLGALDDFAAWFDLRISEVARWISMLVWMEGRMTVESTLEQLAERNIEFGHLTVCEAPDGRAPLYELFNGKVWVSNPRGLLG